MQNSTLELDDIHWLMDMVQTIDVGLVVLDTEYRIRAWNTFMENHSGKSPVQVRERSLFELFPELDENWFRQKTRPVFLLGNRAFTTWQQRPYLFRFNNYHPITGTVDHMYQNTTITPLASPDGKVRQICLTIYDVTDSVNSIE
ncbi:PAS domain-containing protein [Aestuariirhabdus sp. Z084]|uniref:PAS domain-containing protein n=1 Tax=Aestuariirhabdus haliotis TaxID=2918751 RepID=UPI00201B3C83|nr:PAS domain-containing protein [Aestuariirhabdus haliotis]MCL6414864.1 PAS domain-containing protein [Aestuariirhabdus haliotis]MCL6418796.1 PAS domain-containing protein [Aestuariirhabdus haliotis]